VTAVLVLGAGGLLGSEVLAECGSQNLRVRNTAGVFDWNDADALALGVGEQAAAVVSRDQEDETLVVFWCAGVGYVGSSKDESSQPSEALRSALHGLDEIIADGVRVHVTYASSAGAVWSSAPTMPVSESTPAATSHAYGRRKLADEALVREWASLNTATISIARIANLFGRNQDVEKKQGLLSKLVTSTVTGSPTVLFGPLDTSRDYLPAACAAKMLVADAREVLAAPDRDHQPIRIIASGRTYTIAQVCGILQRMRRRRVPLVHVQSEVTAKQPALLSFATERPFEGMMIPSLEESLRQMFEDEFERLALAR